MYGLTIGTGNNTYIKTSLRAFNDYVRKQIVIKTEIEKIASGLQSIVSIMEQEKIMNRFETLAKESFSPCPLMDNGEKISTNAIIADNPNGITIDGFDLIVNNDPKTGEEVKYCIVTYKESPE